MSQSKESKRLTELQPMAQANQEVIRKEFYKKQWEYKQRSVFSSAALPSKEKKERQWYIQLTPEGFIHTLSNKYSLVTFSEQNSTLSTGVNKANMVSNLMEFILCQGAGWADQRNK